MGEIAPLHAFADQRQLGRTLDHHLVFDKSRHARGRRPHHLGQSRPAVAEDPRVAVGVAPDPVAQAHLGQHLLERLHRVWGVGIFEIMIDALDERVGLGVLHFEARHKQPALAFGVHHKCNRPLGGDEGETGVVEDIVAVE
jgi:hypothetical protein